MTDRVVRGTQVPRDNSPLYYRDDGKGAIEASDVRNRGDRVLDAMPTSVQNMYSELAVTIESGVIYIIEIQSSRPLYISGDEILAKTAAASGDAATDSNGVVRRRSVWFRFGRTSANRLLIAADWTGAYRVQVFPTTALSTDEGSSVVEIQFTMTELLDWNVATGSAGIDAGGDGSMVQLPAVAAFTTTGLHDAQPLLVDIEVGSDTNRPSTPSPESMTVIITVGEWNAWASDSNITNTASIVDWSSVSGKWFGAQQANDATESSVSGILTKGANGRIAIGTSSSASRIYRVRVRVQGVGAVTDLMTSREIRGVYRPNVKGTDGIDVDALLGEFMKTAMLTGSTLLLNFQNASHGSGSVSVGVLPTVTTADNGKIGMVVAGNWGADPASGFARLPITISDLVTQLQQVAHAFEGGDWTTSTDFQMAYNVGKSSTPETLTYANTYTNPMGTLEEDFWIYVRVPEDTGVESLSLYRILVPFTDPNLPPIDNYTLAVNQSAKTVSGQTYLGFPIHTLPGGETIELQKNERFEVRPKNLPLHSKAYTFRRVNPLPSITGAKDAEVVQLEADYDADSAVVVPHTFSETPFDGAGVGERGYVKYGGYLVGSALSMPDFVLLLSDTTVAVTPGTPPALTKIHNEDVEYNLTAGEKNQPLLGVDGVPNADVYSIAGGLPTGNWNDLQIENAGTLYPSDGQRNHGSYQNTESSWQPNDYRARRADVQYSKRIKFRVQEASPNEPAPVAVTFAVVSGTPGLYSVADPFSNIPRLRFETRAGESNINKYEVRAPDGTVPTAIRIHATSYGLIVDENASAIAGHEDYVTADVINAGDRISASNLKENIDIQLEDGSWINGSPGKVAPRTMELTDIRDFIIASVSDWARTGNTDPIPSPASGRRTMTQSQFNALTSYDEGAWYGIVPG